MPAPRPGARSRRPRRPPVLFVSWAFVQGRCEEIASSLGGRAEPIYFPRIADRRLAPLRYLLSSVVTAYVLLRDRPGSVIVTNPPIFPGLIAFVYGRVARVAVVLDSHPASFGRKGDAVSARLLPIHRWLAARVQGVLVTADEWVDEVRTWGGRGIVIHEAPPTWHTGPVPAIGARPRVLFVGVFAGDEPVAELVEAARELPECDVLVTGDLRKAPATMVDDAPANVRFVGFLDQARYVREIEQANIIVSLTTEPTSVMRSAYEAVYAQRPLVTSDWPLLEELFPHAVHVENSSRGIAEGVRTALKDYGRLVEDAERALALQEARWQQQMRTLEEMLGPAVQAARA
jgi:hypothetical protein